MMSEQNTIQAGARTQEEMERAWDRTGNSAYKSHVVNDSNRIFDLDVTEWENGGDPEGDGRLYATINILGTLHHLEAVPVKDNEAGEQVGDTPIADEMLDSCFVAFAPDGRFDTTEINGKPYAIFLSPFC